MLSEEERNRALDIKQAVEDCHYVTNISDFECAKLAICCCSSSPNNDNNNKSMDQILDIVHKLECFRNQYRLDDTLEDAMTTLEQFHYYQPGLLLDVSYIPSEQCYTSSSDMAKMNFTNLQTEDQWRAFQGGCYYWITSMESDFTSIRNGIIVLNECEGMSMLNFNIRAQERAINELWSYYPAKHQESVWLNAPVAATMFYGFVKSIINNELLQSWKLDGPLDGYDGRLDTLFLMPTLELSQQALLHRMEGFLRQRYDNIQSFSLTNNNVN